VQLPASPFSLRPRPFFRFCGNFFRAFSRALRFFRKNHLDALISFGGFSGVAPCCAAFVLRKPIFLHESNLRMGRTIRFFAPVARRVFLPPAAKILEKYRDRKKFVPLGYPIREEFVPLERREARRRLGIPARGRLLLVSGGSQGARALVEWLRSGEWELARRGIHCICLTGLGGECRKNFNRGADGCFYVTIYEPFCDFMHVLCSAADVAVGRSGAGTIAEAIVCVTPTIFVPYPQAADEHQMANAEHMVARGAAMLLPQREIGRLMRMVVDCPEGRLEEMRNNLRRLGEEAGDAAEELAAAILGELQREGHGRR
jgi:UDP-N-acetylglucosamine--N-acetylmuramyl-(pentapeptide) pyrophosphoryl-undecaprenol N-acetylglucosamine transferase